MNDSDVVPEGESGVQLSAALQDGRPEISSAANLDLKDALDAMDSAIHRLNRMGIAMRQSNQSKSMFGDPHDISAFTAFRELSFRFIQCLYPLAGADLQDRLSTSMAARIDRIAALRARNGQLGFRRRRPKEGLSSSIGEDQSLPATNTKTPPDASPTLSMTYQKRHTRA
jgi:hypothetical protein